MAFRRFLGVCCAEGAPARPVPRRFAMAGMQQRSTSLSIWLRIRRCSTCCWSELIGTTRSSLSPASADVAGDPWQLMRGCVRSCWRRLSSTMLDGSSLMRSTASRSARGIGGVGPREDRRQSVLRDPVLYRAGRRGVARIRPSRDSLAMEHRSHPRQELRRQCGGPHGRKLKRLSAGTQETLKQARLPGQCRRDRPL